MQVIIDTILRCKCNQMCTRVWRFSYFGNYKWKRQLRTFLGKYSRFDFSLFGELMRRALVSAPTALRSGALRSTQLCFAAGNNLSGVANTGVCPCVDIQRLGCTDWSTTPTSTTRGPQVRLQMNSRSRKLQCIDGQTHTNFHLH